MAQGQRTCCFNRFLIYTHSLCYKFTQFTIQQLTWWHTGSQRCNNLSVCVCVQHSTNISLAAYSNTQSLSCRSEWCFNFIVNWRCVAGIDRINYKPSMCCKISACCIICWLFRGFWYTVTVWMIMLRGAFIHICLIEHKRSVLMILSQIHF